MRSIRSAAVGVMGRMGHRQKGKNLKRKRSWHHRFNGPDKAFRRAARKLDQAIAQWVTDHRGRDSMSDLRTATTREIPYLHGLTGIYVRAIGQDGRWDSYDIAELDRDSLDFWLRSRDSIDWPIGVVKSMLGWTNADLVRASMVEEP